MTQRSENLQPSLFEAERPCVELRAAQKSELAMVIEVLLREIAAALARRLAQVARLGRLAWWTLSLPSILSLGRLGREVA